MSYSHFHNVRIAGVATTVPRNIEVLDFEKGEECLRDNDLNFKRTSVEQQTASDLGFVAAQSIIEKKGIDRSQIGIVVFVSRTPDYRNPPSAAVLQHRLGLQKDCLAYDINIGGTGFTSALNVGCSLVESMPIKYGILIVGDTSSKLNGNSNNINSNQGDGASAILLEKDKDSEPIHILTKSFGESYNSYILREGGFRVSDSDLPQHLVINQHQYTSFVKAEIPKAINSFLKLTATGLNDYNLIVVKPETIDHINQLYNDLGQPKNYFKGNPNKYGHISSASIPLLIYDFSTKLKSNKIKVLCANYGEGFSLGISSFSIGCDVLLPIIESDDFFEDGAVSREL